MKWIIVFLLSLIIIGCSNSINTSDDCNNLQANDLKDSCLIREAVLENKSNYCDKIEIENYKDACYMQLSAWTNNANFCDSVKLRNNIESCYFFMAAQTNNVSICDRLRNIEGLAYQKQPCYRIASIKNTAPNKREERMLEGEKVLIAEFITSPEQDRAINEEFSEFEIK